MNRYLEVVTFQVPKPGILSYHILGSSMSGETLKLFKIGPKFGNSMNQCCFNYDPFFMAIFPFTLVKDIMSGILMKICHLLANFAQCHNFFPQYRL